MHSSVMAHVSSMLIEVALPRADINASMNLPTCRLSPRNGFGIFQGGDKPVTARRQSSGSGGNIKGTHGSDKLFFWGVVELRQRRADLVTK